MIICVYLLVWCCCLVVCIRFVIGCGGSLVEFNISWFLLNWISWVVVGMVFVMLFVLLFLVMLFLVMLFLVRFVLVGLFLMCLFVEWEEKVFFMGFVVVNGRNLFFDYCVYFLMIEIVFKVLRVRVGYYKWVVILVVSIWIIFLSLILVCFIISLFGRSYCWFIVEVIYCLFFRWCEFWLVLWLIVFGGKIVEFKDWFIGVNGWYGLNDFGWLESVYCF